MHHNIKILHRHGTHDLAVVDGLLVYANNRKDVPIAHRLKHLKIKLQDEHNRKPAIESGRQFKRFAFRKAGNGIWTNGF